MAKKKLSAKQRELRRVRQLMSRASHRGFRWDDEFKSSLSSLSWQKLRTFTPEKLYERATALSDTGEIVSGTKRRKEERSEVSRKAAKTRKFKQTNAGKLLDEQLNNNYGYEYDYDDYESVSEGDLIYNNFEELISSQPGQGSIHLENLFKSEIKKYGKEAVLRSLSEIDYDTIYKAQQVAYYEGQKGEMHSALKALADALNATIPTLHERKQLGEVMDSMMDMNYEY